MAESTQTQESKVEAANAETPEFMLTKTGVVILGAERLGDKLAGLVCKLVEKGMASNIAVLEFRTDNYPREGDEPVFGMAFADTHSAAINLEHCWHMACKKAAEGEEHLSMLGMLWINILSAVGHELDHLIAATDREMYELTRSDVDGLKDMEDSAAERAMEWIIDLAREYNIELPTPDGFGWFGSKIMGLFTTDSTKDLDWVVRLRDTLERGVVYDEGEPGKEIKTMRQFIQMAHASDEDWAEQAVVFASLEEQLDLGEKAVHTDAPAEVELAEEIVEQEPVEMVADKATGMFVGAGTGEEAVTVADDQADAVVSETIAVNNPVDAATAGMMAAAAGVQASLPGMDEVPLPQPVVEEQTMLANAAGTAVPEPTQQATTYTPNEVDPSIMPAIMESLWKTLYHHIFTKCGWSQNPQTGRFFFANAAAVLEGVNIQHIISHFGCDNFIMEYDTLNAQGQYAPETCQGMIRGHLTSKQGLPCYTVYFNIGGRRIKRVFVAQNPEKMNAQNAYSNTAVEAQQGHMISWVYKGEANDNAPFKEKCAVKIKDNNYEVIQ